MKKFLLIPVFCLMFFAQGFATHNRAGEITYKVLDCDLRKYEITITTYTKLCPVCPDRDYLDSVHFGDGVVAAVPRFDFVNLGDSMRMNRYVALHRYMGNGQFIIYFIDPNRNEGIVNIPNSVNVPFCVRTTLMIDNNFGCNSTPVLTKPPIDQGCVGEIFTHNPFAIDFEGDSLSYQLAVPLALINQPNNINVPVAGYSLPAASSSLTLNPITGDLIWNTPMSPGEYNIAFYIIEWRYGYPMDTIMRDMQITITSPCTNNRPNFAHVNDTCILAGQTITFNVTATDTNGNNITLTTAGAPYNSNIVSLPVATFSSNSPSNPVVGTFNWNTQCGHIQPQPYTVFFSAQDNGVPPFVDLTSVNIRVIAPPPQNLTAVPSGNTIILNWSPGDCPTDSGYNIYRRVGPFNGVFNCPCETGVPPASGFVLVATVTGNDTTYIDAVGSIIVGVEYCYVVTAMFSNGSESCPSNQACARLRKDLPVITHASVITTNDSTGSVFVAWEWPDELDQTIYPPPHEYRIYHSPGFFGDSFAQIGTLNSIYDTSFVDTLINTRDSAWSYKIELYYDSAGTPVYLGKSETASTIYVSIAPTDERLNLSWEEHVPWNNHYYDVFRYNGTSWDSVGRAFTQLFSDSMLVNGVTYCYYVQSEGTYSAPGYDTLLNNSQETCAVPFDNVPPCPPVISVTPDCIEESNLLAWTNPNNSCADDVIMYHIYFRAALNNDFQLVQTINNAADTFFIHSGLQSVAGCYYITATDSNLNESSLSAFACVDTCFVYNIPNVFSPDGSGLNDLLHPCDFSTVAEMQIKCPPYQNVRDVDLKFFNRWGEVVFETTDRDIKWNGKNKDSGKDCPDGVYYYTGIVNFIRINGITTKEISGFVHILRRR